MKNIAEGLLDFKTLEAEIFETMCKTARDVTGRFLELLDLRILGSRDSAGYRTVGIRATTVKTLYGEVAYRRRYYRDKKGKHVFLLDEALGIAGSCGLVSENLAEQIAIECSEKSFRKAADTISSLTGQRISAMGAWGVVQQYGEAIGEKQGRLAELDASGSWGHLGNTPSRVVFEEFDDVWLSRQREKRRKPGQGSDADDGLRAKIGKKPMHVGTAYTGWAESKDGSFSTLNKIGCASFGDVSKFASMFEVLLRNCFDMDGVERRITNGDGEKWIRAVAEDHDSVLQLDTYHRSRAIVKAVCDAGSKKRIFDAIGKKDVDKALDIIDGLRVKAKGGPAHKKLDKLYGYFSNNRDILLTWQERGIELPAPPEGTVYRNLGVQESSNCSLITLRMKRRKGSWSEAGANHMAGILCFRNTIGIDTILGVLPEPQPVEPLVEPLSAAKAPLHDGKGYGADWLYAKMPFEDAFRTNGREAIREMLRMRPLSQLSFL